MSRTLNKNIALILSETQTKWGQGKCMSTSTSSEHLFQVFAHDGDRLPLTNCCPRIFRALCRGAQPVPLLEEFLRSFHERMLERMKMVGLDSRIGEVKEEIDFTSTRGTRCSEQAVLRAKHSRTAAHAQREHAPDQPNISQREPIEGVEKLCTVGGGAQDSSCRAADEKHQNQVLAPLRARDANSRDGAALRRKECSTRNRPDRLPRPRVETDKAATIATATATLVRNPFSPDMRRRLTTDTARYLCWASSSSIVHDTRQDSFKLGVSLNAHICLGFWCSV